MIRTRTLALALCLSTACATAPAVVPVRPVVRVLEPGQSVQEAMVCMPPEDAEALINAGLARDDEEAEAELWRLALEIALGVLGVSTGIALGVREGQR